MLVDVKVGRYTSCVLRNDGNVFCWGGNRSGRLGLGSSDDQPHPEVTIAVMLEDGEIVQQLAMGSNAAMVLTEAGNVFCWGSCITATAYSTSLTSQNSPGQIANIASLTSIDLAHWQACGTLVNGDLLCWGRNGQGVLGNGSESLIGSYTHSNFGEIINVGTGYWMSGGGHTCVLSENSKVWCWGMNHRGQAGDASGETCGDYDCVKSPQHVEGFGGAVLVQLNASNASTCVVTDGGQIYCWGQNSSGQLGDGTHTHRGTPGLVLGLDDVHIVQVSLGSGHVCARSDMGDVYCWGSNNNWNQVGDSSDVTQYLPVRVESLPLAAKHISAKTEHTCALLEDNSVWCWGMNSYGQCGITPNEGEVCANEGTEYPGYCSIPRKINFGWNAD